jgi:hypothetical protein
MHAPSLQQFHSPHCAHKIPRTHTSCTQQLKWDWLSVSHCLLMEVATTTAIIVTIMYWAGRTTSYGKAVAATSTEAARQLGHGGNSLIALAQVGLTRQPVVSVHYQLLLLYFTAYGAFDCLRGVVWGYWAYFLPLHKGLAIMVFGLSPPLTAVVFGLLMLIVMGRERLFYAVAQDKRDAVNPGVNGDAV